jgi:hypothetical protein
MNHTNDIGRVPTLWRPAATNGPTVVGVQLGEEYNLNFRMNT